MHLAVFGASGPTGRLVVQQALAAGHTVTAATRNPARFPIDAPHLTAVEADVTDSRSVERVVSGADAVISTFGVPYTRHPVTVYSEGVANIARAMAAQRVSRLVCVSSTTVATGPVPGESFLWRNVGRRLLRNVLGRTVYDDMTRMEHIVSGSDLDWTIVRPGGLFNADQPSDDFVVSEHRLAGHITSRADLAQTLLVEASESRHPRATVQVLTRSGTPSFLTFLREAFGRGD